MPSTEKIHRRNCIPIVYTRGTHYDVGYDVGRTFASIIQNFVETSKLLKRYLTAYETIRGREVYEETLAVVRKDFPQYIRELEGTADGANVPFYKLFLFHLDEILPNVAQGLAKGSSTGCSSIMVNEPDNGEEILGHTEDAYSDCLTNYYFVSAHIINENPEGKWQVTEEKFTSLCYAGHLPGYTMSYNHHGLIFSINTLNARRLNSGKTPRHFITRALLSAENFDRAKEILLNNGSGSGDGCSVNLTFMNQAGDRLFHNIELGPSEIGSDKSLLDMITAKPGEAIIHCNTYRRMPVKEVDESILENSRGREEVFSKLPQPKSKSDVLNMLGDQSNKKGLVFRDYEVNSNKVVTICVGIFDCVNRTWSLYSDNPKWSEPMVVLPLDIKQTSI